jgi:hypothetical protein
VRMESTFRVTPQLHPLYRAGCGHFGFKFKGILRDGKLRSVRCVEKNRTRRGVGSWFIPNVIPKVLISSAPESDSLEFEVRICNMSPSAEFPLGYSFWRRRE